MSRNYIDYNQYLGSQRCCNLKLPGSEGPTGPTGPAAIGNPGHTGPTGSGITGPTGRGCRGTTGEPGPPAVATSVIPLIYNNTNTAIIPSQTLPIQYYSLDMTISAGNNSLTTITFSSSLPAGYQAIIFINGNDVYNHTIGNGSGKITGIDFLNSNSTKTLTQSPGTPKAVLTIYSDGTYTYGNLVLMY
jgi:hypothetical protein